MDDLNAAREEREMTMDTDAGLSARWRDAIDVIASEIAGGEWRNVSMRDVYREQARRILDKVDAIRRRDPTPPASVESDAPDGTGWRAVEIVEQMAGEWPADAERLQQAANRIRAHMRSVEGRAFTPPSTSTVAGGTDDGWTPENAVAKMRAALVEGKAALAAALTPAPSAMPSPAGSEREHANKSWMSDERKALLRTAITRGESALTISAAGLSGLLDEIEHLRADPVRHDDARGEANKVRTQALMEAVAAVRACRPRGGQDLSAYRTAEEAIFACTDRLAAANPTILAPVPAGRIERAVEIVERVRHRWSTGEMRSPTGQDAICDAFVAALRADTRQDTGGTE